MSKSNKIETCDAPFLESVKKGEKLFISYVSEDRGLERLVQLKRVKNNEKEKKILNTENLEKRLQLIEEKLEAIESYIGIDIEIEDPSSVEIFSTETIETSFIIEN